MDDGAEEMGPSLGHSEQTPLLSLVYQTVAQTSGRFRSKQPLILLVILVFLKSLVILV